MIHEGILMIQSFLAAYGIATVFAVGFFEEIFFFVPSTGFFTALGFFILDSRAPFWSVLAPAFAEIGFLASLGIVLGGWLVYGAVYWGGKPFVIRFGRYLRVRWEDIERFYALLERRGASVPVLLFIRVIPAFPIGIMSIACGLMRARLWEFTWTTFVGSIVRVTFLAMVGWYAGREYAAYAEEIAGFERYFAAAIILCIAGFLFMHLKKRRRKLTTNN